MALSTGPSSIETHHFDNFEAHMALLLQQTASKTKSTVTNMSKLGEQIVAVDQIGSRSMIEKTTRNAATPNQSNDTDRRWVTATIWNDGDTFDEIVDFTNMLNDPRSLTVQAMAAAAGRKIDKTVVEALGGNALTGGKYPSGSVALPSSQKIAAGGTGLTAGKLRQAQRIFLDNNVDITLERPTLLATPRQHEDLLAQDLFVSKDYVNNSPIPDGVVGNVYGFDVKVIGAGGDDGEAIMPDTGSEQKCYLYVPSGICLNTWQDFRLQVGKAVERSFNWQYYADMKIGATRTEEGRVIEIATAY